MATESIEIVFDEIYKESLEMVGVFLFKMRIMAEEVLRRAVTDTGSVASHELENSVFSHVEKRTKEFVLSAGYGVYYASYVSEGTRPHFPPVSAIMRWMLLKQVTLDSRFVRSWQSAAFLIARSISRKGTKARRFYEIAFQRLMPIVEREISKMVNA